MCRSCEGRAGLACRDDVAGLAPSRAGRLAAAGVVEVEAPERFAPVLQHSDQTPFSQMRTELVLRQVRNP